MSSVCALRTILRVHLLLLVLMVDRGHAAPNSQWDQQLRKALDRLGHRSLHPWQIPVLTAWREKKDVIVLSGTGSGKSLCFQLPALVGNRPAVIISPLISLMRDQCEQMNARGVASCFLGSAQVHSYI